MYRPDLRKQERHLAWPTVVSMSTPKRDSELGPISAWFHEKCQESSGGRERKLDSRWL